MQLESRLDLELWMLELEYVSHRFCGSNVEMFAGVSLSLGRNNSIVEFSWDPGQRES